MWLMLIHTLFGTYVSVSIPTWPVAGPHWQLASIYMYIASNCSCSVFPFSWLEVRQVIIPSSFFSVPERSKVTDSSITVDSPDLLISDFSILFHVQCWYLVISLEIIMGVWKMNQWSSSTDIWPCSALDHPYNHTALYTRVWNWPRLCACPSVCTLKGEPFYIRTNKMTVRRTWDRNNDNEGVNG